VIWMPNDPFPGRDVEVKGGGDGDDREQKD
jgi:hypothetical protein